MFKIEIKKPKQQTRKVNTRKEPCEVCGSKTNVYHRVACKWAYIPRPSNKAQIKRMTLLEKLEVIINILKS